MHLFVFQGPILTEPYKRNFSQDAGFNSHAFNRRLEFFYYTTIAQPDRIEKKIFIDETRF